MNPKVEPLVIDYLEGSLGASGEADLADHLKSNETDRREFLELCRQERLLECLRGEPDLKTGVVEEILARKEGSKFVKDVLGRLPEKRNLPRRRARHAAGSRRSTGLLVGIAAAALLFLGLAFVMSRPATSPSPPRRVADRPAPPRIPPPPKEAPQALPLPDAPRPPVSQRPASKPEPLIADPDLPKPPTVPPQVPPAPKPPVPPRAPKPVPQTVASVAVVSEKEGEVFLDNAPVSVGAKVARDQQLRTGAGSALLTFLDGTRVRVSGASIAAFHGNGRQIALASGTLTCEVKPQPKDRPFTVETPRAGISVLGTRLTVTGARTSTRLEVETGSVRIIRRRDRRTLLVKAGHFAVAAPGVALRSRSLWGPNLLTDPGFEQNGRGWRKFLGDANEKLSFRSIVTETPHAGVRCAEIQSSRREHDVFQDVAVEPGASYDLRAWIRTEAPGPEGAKVLVTWLTRPVAGTLAEIETFVLKNAGAVIRTDEAVKLAKTRDWTRLSARLEAPPGARAARIHLKAEPDPDDAGHCRFDDLSFRRLNP